MLNRMNRHNPLLFLLIAMATSMVCTQQIKAQDINENNFVLYTKEQGLSQNNITGIVQDSIGYIWISTSSGLNRFNGTRFIQIQSSNDSFSAPTEYISSLVWLDNKRIAAISDEGLHIINTRTGEQRNLIIPYHDKKYQYKFNWIMSVSSDKDGDIFVVARSGFYHFDNNYHIVFRFDYYPEDQIDNTTFVFGRNLISLSDQGLAILSTVGIFYYDIKKRELRKMGKNDCPLSAEFMDYPKNDCQFFQKEPGCIFIFRPHSDSMVYLDIHANKKSNIPLPFPKAFNEFDYRSKLVSVNDTTLYITGKESGFYKIKFSKDPAKIKFYSKKYFSSYACHQMLLDRNDNLWIATKNGLFHQNIIRNFVQSITIPATLQSRFPNISVDDIFGVKKKLYVATHGSGGILVFEKKGLRFIKRIGFENYYRHPNDIFSIVAANKNTLLVGTNGPLFKLNTKTDNILEVNLDNWNRDSAWIADLFQDRNGNVWIASEKIYKYDTTKRKASLISGFVSPLDKIEDAKSIQEDKEGNIWIAGHGLLRYNTSSNKFDMLVDSFPFIKIPDRQINSFIADDQNNLWINSNNNGLICYNIGKKTFRLYCRDNGLPDNNIAAMIIVRNKLWMATFSGIACLDLQNQKITSYGREDGFPDQPIGRGPGFFYDSLENKLYIGYENTIVQFNPDIISKRIPSPNLFIESITINGQNKFMFPGKSINTNWQNNNITLSIGNIDVLPSKNERFAYRLLENGNMNWQQLGNQNIFSISNLSPGFHQIEVKLFSPRNRWPEQVKEFDVIVSPPVWQRTWFIILFTAFLFFFLYRILKWNTSRIRKKEAEKTQIQKLKAEEYKNQFELEQISNYFSSSLANKKNVDDVLWDVSKNLIGRLNYEDCMIYLWNEDKTRMIQRASYGPKGDPKSISNKLFDVLPGQGIVGYVIQTKEPLIVKDTRKDSRYRVDDIMRLSELCVPIIHNSELIGIIDSEHSDENHFRERDIKILTTISTLMMNKIKQIESEQSLEIKQREINIVNQQLAEAQLSALQTQMNPHFIFNSLNSIKFMILQNEQQKASRYLSKFADMIRTTLDQSKKVFTTLHENMEHLGNYLAMEKLRFDDSFTYRITADDEIDKEDIYIPTMMIQPLAENAIWHGLNPKKGKKKLSIHFSSVGGTISCKVEDNGIGIKHSDYLKSLNRPLHKSVGLSNLQNRIKLMNEKYNTNCTLEIIDLEDLNNNKTGCCALLSFNSNINKQNL